MYFSKTDKESYVHLLIYVDDMLIISKDKNDLVKLKRLLKIEFEIKDLGLTKRILGMSIDRHRVEGILTLSQSVYLRKVL